MSCSQVSGFMSKGQINDINFDPFYCRNWEHVRHCQLITADLDGPVMINFYCLGVLGRLLYWNSDGQESFYMKKWKLNESSREFGWNMFQGTGGKGNLEKDAKENVLVSQTIYSILKLHPEV